MQMPAWGPVFILQLDLDMYQLCAMETKGILGVHAEENAQIQE